MASYFILDDKVEMQKALMEIKDQLFSSCLRGVSMSKAASIPTAP